jgi:hypothetical protein
VWLDRASPESAYIDIGDVTASSMKICSLRKVYATVHSDAVDTAAVGHFVFQMFCMSAAAYTCAFLCVLALLSVFMTGFCCCSFTVVCLYFGCVQHSSVAAVKARLTLNHYIVSYLNGTGTI